MWTFDGLSHGRPTLSEKGAGAVAPLAYDRVYGAFWDSVIERDGKAAVARSAQRYLRAIER